MSPGVGVGKCVGHRRSLPTHMASSEQRMPERLPTEFSAKPFVFIAYEPWYTRLRTYLKSFLSRLCR